MKLDLATLDRIAGTPVNRQNAEAMLAGIAARGAKSNLSRRAPLAQYLAQIMHESGSFRYDRELWGPTAAQDRYDTRVDLGNTPERDGDGEKFKGRTAIQITGRANYRAFRDWCASKGLNPPDFEEFPELVLTDPWEGLGPVWYWETRAGLRGYAEAGNFEMVTRRVNGGTNGWDDRLRYLTRASLVLLGRDPDSIREFQAEKGLEVDGIVGPETRKALHAALVEMDEAETVDVKPKRLTMKVLDKRIAIIEKLLNLS